MKTNFIVYVICCHIPAHLLRYFPIVMCMMFNYSHSIAYINALFFLHTMPVSGDMFCSWLCGFHFQSHRGHGAISHTWNSCFILCFYYCCLRSNQMIFVAIVVFSELASVQKFREGGLFRQVHVCLFHCLYTGLSPIRALYRFLGSYLDV